MRSPGAGFGIRSRVTTSWGARTVFQMPSATKKSLSDTVRVPSAEARSTSAPRVMRTGGVSAECAATQRVPPGTTWQTVPSFLRQKPSAFRQK